MMDNGNDIDKAKPRVGWWFVGLTAAVFACLTITYLISAFIRWPSNAAFGDTFGLASALFSGLAFGGLIIAIILQKRDLELQRIELRESRIAQSKTAKTLEKQYVFMMHSAKLNAKTAQLQYYANRRIYLESQHVPASDPRLTTITEKIEELDREIEALIGGINWAQEEQRGW